MERAKRIELSSQPWQGRVLPLNHARKNGELLPKNYTKLNDFCTTLFFAGRFFLFGVSSSFGGGRRLFFIRK